MRVAGGTTDLASEAFTSETSSGWQTVYFDTPVPVAMGFEDPYVVWVSMPNGHYAVDGGAAGGSNHFDEVAPVAFGDRYNDVVYLKSGNTVRTTFPATRAANSTWYGVDVDFFIP